jgi:hypothetical protein
VRGLCIRHRCYVLGMYAKLEFCRAVVLLLTATRKTGRIRTIRTFVKGRITGTDRMIVKGGISGTDRMSDTCGKTGSSCSIGRTLPIGTIGISPEFA